MNCCLSSNTCATETVVKDSCRRCGETGRVATKQTVIHQVRSEKLATVKEAEYKFCSSRNCEVVYYSTSGEFYTVDDLREAVTSKTIGDGRPLCYCFGFSEGDVRSEIEKTGSSSIPDQITRFIKEKLCACEIRNPAGSCCLGEINRTVKRLGLAERTALGMQTS